MKKLIITLFFALSGILANAQLIPNAPIISYITQPTCTDPSGSVILSGLPASGIWIVTESIGNTTISGTGTVAVFPGLAENNTYTFTVTNSYGNTSPASAAAVINIQPSTPGAPIIGAITQPTCTDPTGSVALSGLPTPNFWIITEMVNYTSISDVGYCKRIGFIC